MLVDALGSSLQSVSLDALLADAALASAAAAFLRRERAEPVAGPPRLHLCLLQGEAATLRVDGSAVIGSQDATTCLVAVLACPLQRVVWAAHVDAQLRQGDLCAIEAAAARMQRPQLFLAGAYCDARGLGPGMAQSFLQAVHALRASVQLRLCCVAQANTLPDGAPATCALALDTADFTPKPWHFADRGPELPRRLAANHCRRDAALSLVPVWSEANGGQLVLCPFDPTLNSLTVLCSEQLMRLDDDQLLASCSTSPAHEPHWFAEDMRSMLAFIIRAQEPHSQERRAAALERRWAWAHDGGWAPAQALVGAAATGVAASPGEPAA